MEKNQEEQTEIIHTENSDSGDSGSSTGLEEHIAGFLCYLATFITGIIFLIIEKKSKFVRFHAMQSIVLFVGIWVVGFLIDYIPFGWILRSLISLFGFIMWITLMIKAYQKEYFKVPVVGDIAENFLNKQN